jgi:hypothetical protein
LQGPVNEQESKSLAEKFKALETRLPTPGVAASIFDPALYIAERRELLAHFSHFASQSAAQLTTVPDHTPSHSTAEALPLSSQGMTLHRRPRVDIGVQVLTASPKADVNVGTQTSSAESSMDSDSSPPSDSDSDESDADAIDFDEEAGYGVSTRLP